MRPAPYPHRLTALPLWPLPVAAGCLPALAVLVAWCLSSRLGLVPLSTCNVGAFHDAT